MRKFLFSLFILTLVLTACEKYKTIRNDADSKLFIYGRLFIQDSINDNGVEKPLAKEVDVFLRYKNDSANFLNKVKTDAQGYFTFKNLVQGKTYIVSTSTETGEGDFKVSFAGESEVLLNESKEDCTPVLKFDRKSQNGVFYTIKDNTGGLINDCEACFFSSRQIWLRDTCSFGLLSIKSNTKGMAIKTNLLPGKYYLLFKKQAGALLLQHKDSIDIQAKGILERGITLQ